MGRRRRRRGRRRRLYSLLIGFNLALFIVATAILGGIALYAWSRSVEGPRRATDRGVTYAIAARSRSR